MIEIIIVYNHHNNETSKKAIIERVTATMLEEPLTLYIASASASLRGSAFSSVSAVLASVWSSAAVCPSTLTVASSVASSVCPAIPLGEGLREAV